MSYYAISKAADELGVSRNTALLIWELAIDKDDFQAMLEDFAAGHGLVMCS